MTDYKSTIAELRYLADWAKHHLDKAKIANDAADAIEALQAENERLMGVDRDAKLSAVMFRENRTAWESERDALQSKLGDAIRSLANWQHQCTELQAENERLKAEREKDAFRLVWAMNWMRMSVHDHGFTKHVLERGGTADYSDCATYIDKCTTATQEADHGIHAKGGQQ